MKRAILLWIIKFNYFKNLKTQNYHVTNLHFNHEIGL